MHAEYACTFHNGRELKRRKVPQEWQATTHFFIIEMEALRLSRMA